MLQPVTLRTDRPSKSESRDRLGEALANRMIDHDRLARSHRPDGMQRAGGNNAHKPRSGDSRLCADGDFQLAFDDVPDLFLRMIVTRDDRACVELIMPKGHAGRIEIPPMPARLALDNWQLGCVNKGHDPFPSRPSPCISPFRDVETQVLERENSANPAGNRPCCARRAPSLFSANLRAALAQPVEQRIRNAWVGCSSHPGGTNLVPLPRK